jgi:hypothetical protein
MAQGDTGPTIHAMPRQDRFLDRLVFEWVASGAYGADEREPLLGTGVMFGGDEAVRWDDPRFEADGALLFKVAGTSFRPGVLSEPYTNVGSRVRLVREPDNPADPNAVAVYDEAARNQIGYVPRDLTAAVTRLTEHAHGALVFYEWRFVSGERSGVRCALGPPRFVDRLERFIGDQ